MSFVKLEDLTKKYLIIDSHLHLGALSYLYMPSNTEENIVNLLKKIGVKKAICANHGSLSTINYGSEELFEVLTRYDDLLYGYLVFNPNFKDVSLKSIKKNIDRNHIAGIKIHPSWHLCYPYDKRYENFWQFAAERKIPVLTHSWDPDVSNKSQKFSDPFGFENIIKKFPNLKLILAHAGGRGKMLYDVITLMENYPNIYVDFAGDIFVAGLIEEYVERVGSERLLFGSDMPWVDIRFHLAYILNLNIGEMDKKNILGLNALKLFNLEI
ncbi:MAG: amidohydrolase family protein [Candidatus Humimicrobiaceae bacterium]